MPFTRFKIFIGLLGLAGAQWSLNAQLTRMDAAWVELPRESRPKTNPELFKALTFGHWPAAVDWFWITALLDPGLQPVEAGMHASIFPDLDLATDLDPAFFEGYVAGSSLLTVVRNDNLGAKTLLEKGQQFRAEKLGTYPSAFREKYWAKEWQLLVVLAYVELFEFNHMPEAARAFSQAAPLAGAPAYLLRLANRLDKPGGEYEVGRRLLRLMMTQASGDQERRELKRKEDSLILAQYLHELNLNFRSYLNSLPEYRSRSQVSSAQMNRWWKKFLSYNQLNSLDPWGGFLQLGKSGQVISSTPHVPVFGLE